MSVRQNAATQPADWVNKLQVCAAPINQQTNEAAAATTTLTLASNSTTTTAVNGAGRQAARQRRVQLFSPRHDQLERREQLDERRTGAQPAELGSGRLVAPRLSLLGKPIYLGSHKAHYRDTRSMRWRKRLRAFLEQPQGLLPWLYHSSL